jgi:hypothetical protein
MKKLATIVVMLCCTSARGGAAPNPADYNINVHVSSARFNSRGAVMLTVTLEGKKCVLEGLVMPRPLLVPGDYKVKALPLKVKDAHTYDAYGTYEFLFPDGKTRTYGLAGITE